MTAFYIVLGLVILTPDAVYSGDIGVKFVQARALAAHRFVSLDIPYPGAFLDPGRRFFALRPPFVMRAGGETQAIFPPASAAVQAVAVAFGGVQGMVAVTLLAAVVTLYSTARMAEPALRPFVTVALGLGGPFWFFAICGWEHAPAVAGGAAAFACALVAPVRWAGLFAGLCLGLGATQRDEVLLLAPGLLLVLWLRTRAWPPIAIAAGALVVVVIATAAVDVWWFGRPPAAHLRHAVHFLQGSWMAAEPGADVPSLRPFTMRQRYETVVQYWLFGYGNDRLIAAYVLGFLVAVALWWLRRSSAGLLVWLIAVVALAGIDLYEVVTAPKWLAGMQRVSPYFVFAWLPPAAATRWSWQRHAALATAGAYIALAFAGVDTTGGKSLGPRLLLPLFPILTVAAMASIRDHLRAPTRTDRWIGALGVMLVTMTLVMHAAGTIPAYVARNRDDGAAIQAVAAAPERIVVSDDMFTAQLLMPLYFRKIILLADRADLAAALGDTMTAERIGGVMLVARGEPRVRLDPLQMTAAEQKGRFVIQHWSRR